MKTIIKVVVAIALINAAARVGMAYAGFYQLKDQAQELVTFNGARSSDGDLQNQILAKAASLNLPVEVTDIDVQHDGLFPNYKYPMKFHFTVDAIGMSGLGANVPTPSARN
jgi:hypothetical protein